MLSAAKLFTLLHETLGRGERSLIVTEMDLRSYE